MGTKRLLKPKFDLKKEAIRIQEKQRNHFLNSRGLVKRKGFPLQIKPKN
jgi:hypothetical protein